MAHNKVYGICENKCKVEVIPSMTDQEFTNMRNPEIELPLYNARYVYDGGSVRSITLTIPDDVIFNCDYRFEITAKIYGRVSKPSLFLIASGVKFINDDLDTSSFNVLHYKIYHDGLNLCCECSGYVS